MKYSNACRCINAKMRKNEMQLRYQDPNRRTLCYCCLIDQMQCNAISLRWLMISMIMIGNPNLNCIYPRKSEKENAREHPNYEHNSIQTHSNIETSVHCSHSCCALYFGTPNFAMNLVEIAHKMNCTMHCIASHYSLTSVIVDSIFVFIIIGCLSRWNFFLSAINRNEFI